MKNIIITGASGFLGTKIYNYFNSNYLVCSVGRSLKNDLICDLSTNVPVFSNIFFGIKSLRASYKGLKYGSIFSFKSPGKKPNLSPASTAGLDKITFSIFFMISNNG